MKQLSVISESEIFTQTFGEARCKISMTLGNPNEAKLEKLLRNLCEKTRDEQIKFLQEKGVLDFDALRIALVIIFRDVFAAEKLKISSEVIKKINAEKF